MPFPFLSKSKKAQADAAKKVAVPSSPVKHATRLAQAVELMEKSKCGQAIAVLKDVADKSADAEVWLMRAALYAQRDEADKARQCFSQMVEQLVKEQKPCGCWIWTPGVDDATVRLLGEAVPSRLGAVRFAERDDGLLAGKVTGGSGATQPPEPAPGTIRPYAALTCFAWAVRQGAVIVASLSRGLLTGTPFAELEAEALGKVGRRTLIVPGDEEVACMSRIYDPCVRYAWLTRDRGLVRRERELQEHLARWAANAGMIVSHFLMDAQGRWDILFPRFTFVEPSAWPERRKVEGCALRVLHFDDHPDYSGTIFVEHAVNQLKAKGTAIELLRVKSGDEAARKRCFEQADVFVDGLNAPGYSALAVEAMASGVVVLANMEAVFNCQVYRRYSFLQECPVKSATPESVETVLGALAADRGAVDETGACGRSYVNSRHSLKAAATLFRKIDESFQKSPFEEEARPSLINFYHPKQWALTHTPNTEPPLEQAAEEAVD